MLDPREASLFRRKSVQKQFFSKATRSRCNSFQKQLFSEATLLIMMLDPRAATLFTSNSFLQPVCSIPVTYTPKNITSTICLSLALSLALALSRCLLLLLSLSHSLARVRTLYPKEPSLLHPLRHWHDESCARNIMSTTLFWTSFANMTTA